MNGSALRQRMLDMLMEKVREDRFPSVTMMDRIEGSLDTPEQIEDYAETLIEKIQADRFPSISMLNRIDGVIARLG